MEFNIQKCKVMHLGHNNTRAEYKMKGQTLESVEEETDIGVRVSRTLKPGVQCKKAAKTATTVLAQITRAFHYRDRHTFMKLYTTYVRPHLEFATPAWAPWTETDISCLEKVQIKAVSMVSGLTSHTYEEKLAELGMLTLAERRHQLDMLQMYKVLHNKDTVNSDDWFDMAANGERRTRAAADPLNVRIPAPRLEVRKNFFTQRVAEPWNKTPAALKSAATAEGFRHGYRKHRGAELAAVQPR
jgi:hypothetical protein